MTLQLGDEHGPGQKVLAGCKGGDTRQHGGAGLGEGRARGGSAEPEG